MIAADFVARLRSLDVRVAVDGDRLRCSAPPGVLTDALRAELSSSKTELIAWLRAHPDASPDPTPDAGFDGRRVSRCGINEFPLSFAQQRLWFLDQLQPGSSAYTITLRRRFHDALDADALRCALDDLIRRHESLRTTFPSKDGAPVQRVNEPEAVALPIVRVDESDAVRGTIARIVAEHAARPFDLARGPLVRPLLVAVGSDYHELCISVHHIVADGWSLEIIARDLSEMYAARLEQRPARLAALPVQYADWALWQRRELSGPALEAQRRYWLEELANLAGPLDLPTDYPRSGRSNPVGASHDFVVPFQLAERLRALSLGAGATRFITLLAAFKVLLSRWSGKDDIVVGTPVANRSHVELESVVGFFTNTLALRTQLVDDPSFRTLLARVRETCLGAYANPDMPFEKLVEELQPDRVLGQNPVFQVSFVLQNATVGPEFSFVTSASPFDLTLFVREGPNGRLGASIQYARDLFEPATIARLSGQFVTLLASIVADPDCPISALPLQSEAETNRMLIEWNATATPYPRDRTVHGLFEDQADATPDAIALAFEGTAVTYAELDRRANRLGHYLRAAGVGAQTPVATLIDRSAESIVALLGILKAGGAYVALDLAAPPSRLLFMLRDASASVLLTTTALRTRVSGFAGRTICLDAEATPIASSPHTRLAGSVSALDLAYVSYTSGSTGDPKGVEATHRNIVRLVKADYARFGADETTLQLAPLSFDASTFEIWGALLNGGRLVVAPPRALSAAELGAIVEARRVTTLWLTAGLFERVVEDRIESLRPLRQLLAGGDVLSPEHVRRVRETFPELRLVNGYGPTEGTTFTCCHTVEKTPATRRSVPIGKPIANTRVYVLDHRRRPVPVGARGELWIAGDGLARGYRNRPRLTAERFVVHRLSPVLEERLYRTGDLVRWLSDGTLEFLGRIDDQTKIRGFRVEPGEIEAALARHPGVRDCVVIAIRGADGGARLAAYVVGSGAPPELREFLARSLPAYMIPTAFVPIDRLPLNTAGKVDRRALPDLGALGGSGALVEPRDDLERQIAEVWRDVLAVEQLGIRDSFFDLGGHSLLAVRMFARLEKQLGVVLPLAALFEAPTIEGLADAIRRGTRPTSGRSLVAIQPAGGAPPLFVVPGVGGSILGYHTLARLLGMDQPFYGLQSRGLDGITRPLTRIETIAAEYLAEIRQVQPVGPYYLMGTCMGGVVTYEMAQQLRASGQEVAFLGLVETWPPPSRATRGAERTMRAPPFAALVWARLKLYAATFRKLNGRELLRFVGGRLKRVGSVMTGRDPLLGVRGELSHLAVTNANLAAFESYVPRPYADDVVLFWAEGRRVEPAADSRRVWLELAPGRVEVCVLPGDDSGLMLTEPHVHPLAAKLKERLARARTRCGIGHEK